MPERPEAGRFFSQYVQRYLDSQWVQDHPDCTKIEGIWADMIEDEAASMQSREDQLLKFSCSLHFESLEKGTHRAWAETMRNLAAAIPDTHGLLIHDVWLKLPLNIRSQISENHVDWDQFCDAISCLEVGEYADADPISMPWHRSQDADKTSILPFKIGSSPSKSGLAVRLTRQMPPIYRGDLDLDPDAPDADDAGPDNSDATPDRNRYLWPQHPRKISTALSNPKTTVTEAFKTSGLQLKGVSYHPRMLVLDLTTCHVELEPLLHSSPQIFTIVQWEGVCQVPKEERGYKIAIAFKMVTHVLALLSHDNLWGVFWRSSVEFLDLQRDRVPDSVLDFHGWCEFHANHLRKYAPKFRTTTTIYQWMISSGPHPFQGNGRYCSAEVLALAGIPPWVPVYDVLMNETAYCILTEADFQFHSERWFLIDDMIDKMLAGNAPDDFSLGANVKDQLDYGKHLRVHAQKEWHVNPRLANLVREYNQLAINTRKEAQDLSRANIFIQKTDITTAIHPFDLSNIAPALLQFGHLGDRILDSYRGRSLVEKKRWANLLANEIPENIMTVSPKFLSKPQKKLRQTLDQFMKTLPDSLSPFQRLALTPTPCLSADEIQLLEAQFGTVNPITKYFQELRHNILKNMKGAKRSESTKPKLPFQFDPDSLSLLPESERPSRLPVILLRVKNEKRGKVWTVLEPPWIEVLKKVKVGNKNKMIGTGQWKHVDESKYLMEHVKKRSLGWTVGPADFCGHAHVIGQGIRGRSKGLCFWHQDMPDKQKLLMKANWTARSKYPSGMRHLEHASLGAEKQWRTSRQTSIRQANTHLTEAQIRVQIRLRRAKERQGLLAKGRSLLDAALEMCDHFKSDGPKERRSAIYSTIVPKSRKYSH
ncbi:hypothetical protein DFH06DRAFT_1164140 [Mycena polygramma]|nr:hypothetical protein DFH06DRAFT_1164140 [Mycena polygramma]